MKQDLFIGDRIQISTLGASRCPRLAGRTGTIVGLSIYANSVSVRLDGNKSRSTFHRDYLQVILAAAEPIRSPCACRR
jgi:ribosomal protein L21E